MGGHGGLNILPQKSWNVYGRENRLKVARDEAKHAAEEEELKQRHQAAERQYRHSLLLQRARQREAGDTSDVGGSGDTGGAGDAAGDDAAGVTEDALCQQLSHEHQEQQLDATDRHRRKRQRVSATATAAAALAPGEAAVLEAEAAEASFGSGELRHINFWEELEVKAQHPERQKEQRDQLRKRGNPDTQTSDARFDESFSFGHNMAAAQQPWYARKVASQPLTLEQRLAGKGHPTVSAGQAFAPALAAPCTTIATAAATGDAVHSSSKAAADDEITRLLTAVVAGRNSSRHKRQRVRSPVESSGDNSSSSDSSSSDNDGSSSGDSESGESNERGSRKRKHGRSSREWRQGSGKDRERGSKHKRQKHSNSSRSKSISKHNSSGRRSKDNNKHKHRGHKEGREKHNDKDGRAERRRKQLQARLQVLLGQRKSVQQLREERIEREHQERSRAEAVKAGLQGDAKGYKTGYGFANELKRQRQLQ